MPPIPPRRLVAAALVAAAIWMLPAALAGSGGSIASLLESALGSSCASAAGTVHVGVVVDFVGAKPSTRTCATMSDRGTGFDALTAAGHTFRVNGSGLLCAIDGYPVTGCGDRTSTGYRYWSYWHGGSAWTYANTGPDGVRPKDGSVEGWRWVDGTSEEAAPPPSASPASPCTPATDPTTPATTAAPGGAGGPGGSGSSGGSGSGGPTTTTTVAGSTPDATVSTTDPSTGGPGSSDDLAGSGTTPDGTGRSDEALGATAPASSSGHDSGVPLGAIGLSLAVAALAGSALFRWRTRAAP